MGAAQAADGNIYLAGGLIGATGLPPRDVRIFDPGTGAWAIPASLLWGDQSPSVVILGGKDVDVISGWNDTSYDPRVEEATIPYYPLICRRLGRPRQSAPARRFQTPRADQDIIIKASPRDPGSDASPRSGAFQRNSTLCARYSAMDQGETTSMKSGLTVGATGEISIVTTPDMAITLSEGPPRLSVLSTPAVLWQLEAAGHEALRPFLDPGETSVGVTASITHLAPTPIGMRITARATVTAIDRRRISFAVEAFDEREKIAEGTHDRFVIDIARFAARVNEKAAS